MGSGVLLGHVTWRMESTMQQSVYRAPKTVWGTVGRPANFQLSLAFLGHQCPLDK